MVIRLRLVKLIPDEQTAKVNILGVTLDKTGGMS